MFLYPDNSSGNVPSNKKSASRIYRPMYFTQFVVTFIGIVMAGLVVAFYFAQSMANGLCLDPANASQSAFVNGLMIMVVNIVIICLIMYGYNLYTTKYKV